MNFREFIKNNIVYLDGGLGTLLQERNLLKFDLPERLNITHKEEIIKIHKEYFDSGSNIVCANTFGANLLKYSVEELDLIIKSAIENAKIARGENFENKFIALDVGPTGKLLKPYGDLDFEKAVEIFSHTIKLGQKYGADLIFIETMNDSLETKAAVISAKENSNLPIFVSNAYGNDGKLITGATPSSMVCMLEGLGVDAIGANCSYGPKQLINVIEEILSVSSTPVIFKPNAGIPKSDNGKTYYDLTTDEFSSCIYDSVLKGVSLIGGCCGTTPKHISSLYQKTKNLPFKPISAKNLTCVSSYTHAVYFDKPLLIGERINPTGKKNFKQALINGDINYVLNEGLKQQEKGVHLLDVNVGIPDIDENVLLPKVVYKLQSVIDLPLQIDTSSPIAMEKALRIYNGKPMINSVNGKKESMERIFPLAKKYGGVVVALTLDENGIPDNAYDRFLIAKKILKRAKKYGIDKKDIIFDPLTLTIATNENSANITIESLKLISTKLKAKTILGVSNISFGLPNREIINSNFFTLCLLNGLSSAIINPFSQSMLGAYYSFLALNGKDKNCSNYINFATIYGENSIKPPLLDKDITLFSAITNGLTDKVKELTNFLLETLNPLEIINKHIIPALDSVGQDYENKKIFLPKMLMSAESAKTAFEEIKKKFSIKSNLKCPIVIATVKGDIHDIGKNIVAMLLENYGFNVIDLGKDVDKLDILNAVIENKAPMLGLSALMTTTVESMKETIELVKEKAPNCIILVGGAVLNEDYAKKINADKYCKDALSAVRYAKEVYKSLNK